MNYRHAYHAGNFADVFKHIVLVRLIEYMQRKEKAFRIYDTHAGLGLYNLASEEAGKTEEWKHGYGLIEGAEIPPKVLKLLSPWLDIVKSVPDGYYPGSPKVSRQLMRKQDRLSLYELHEQDHRILAKNFSGDYQTKVFNLDGWYAAGAHTPPKEGRGLMLVDPPFEDGEDFDRMIDVLDKTRKRWAGGTVALWYPVKRRDHTDEWLGTLRGMGFPDLINAEIYIREPNPANMLNGCGLVIANPPYVLRQELEAFMPWLAKTFSQGKGSGHRIQMLSKK